MEVDGYVMEMLRYLHDKCPYLMPNVFPSYMSIASLQDVFSDQSHLQQLQQWLGNSSSTMEYAISTSIDYHHRTITIVKIHPCPEMEHRLRNLEETMLLLLSGSHEEIHIATQYFLEMNKYECSSLHELERIRLLQEIYNVAYAVKVALRYVHYAS